jgi:hypothetical protein
LLIRAGPVRCPRVHSSTRAAVFKPSQGAGDRDGSASNSPPARFSWCELAIPM